MFAFTRWFEGEDAGHRVKRINNPGEAVLKLFFTACVLAILVGVVVMIVREITYRPEFHPLTVEELPHE